MTYAFSVHRGRACIKSWVRSSTHHEHTHSRQGIALQLGVVGHACNPRTPEMEAENREFKAEFHSQTLSQTKSNTTAKVMHSTPRIYRRSKVRV